MALFSRRPKATDAEARATAPADAPRAGGDAEPLTDATAPPSDDVAAGGPLGPAPEVSISVSSFDGLGVTRNAAAPPAPRPASPIPAEAPPAETVAGVPENVLLREAAAAFAAEPDPTHLINVARQLMQGQVYLRVKGDARALLTEGRRVPFAVATRGDQQFAAIFSGARALSTAVQADRATDTSALGQPAQAVLRHVLAGSYAGVVIDQWPGRTSPVLPRALVSSALDEADPRATIKTLLAADRTPETAGAVAAALGEQRVWLAAKRAEGTETWGIAESTLSDGTRHLTLFSHPLEVAVLGRGDRPVPVTAAQLAGALAADTALAGVIVDPAGPWIRLSRDDLAPVLARSGTS